MPLFRGGSSEKVLTINPCRERSRSREFIDTVQEGPTQVANDRELEGCKSMWI